MHLKHRSVFQLLNAILMPFLLVIFLGGGGIGLVKKILLSSAGFRAEKEAGGTSSIVKTKTEE